MPIGQVLFVPREEITLRDGTEEEMAARRRSNETFFREKVAVKLKTAYGLAYSHHYLRTSCLQNTTSGPRGADVTASDTTDQLAGEPPGSLVQRSAMGPWSAPQASVSRKVGRNDPCPCGSGRKYKKCHGEAS